MSKLYYMIVQKTDFNEIKAYLNNLSKEEQLAEISYNDYGAFRYTAYCGHLELFKWYIKIAPDLKLKMIRDSDYYAFRLAAKKGHLELCKWLIEIAPDDLKPEMIQAQNYEAFVSAAENGHLDTCKWLIKIAHDLELEMIEIAPDLKLKMVKALNYQAFRKAAQNGHLDTCKWLIEIAPDDLKPEMIQAIDYLAFSFAIRNGHYPCAVYIYMIASEEDKHNIMQLDFKNKDIFEQIFNHPLLSEMNAASLASSGFWRQLSQGKPLSMLKFMHVTKENQKSTYNETSKESAKAVGKLSIAFDPVRAKSDIIPSELIKTISQFMVYNEEPKMVFDFSEPKQNQDLSK